MRARALRPRMLAAAVALAGLTATASVARADGVDLKLSGAISTDLRYRLGGELVPPTYPSQYRLLESGFSRNENRLRAGLTLKAGDHVRAVSDIELVYYGYSDVNTLDGETLHERVDPYYIEAHAAYVDLYKLLPGLDLRIGRQVVHWGASDQFNPTSNVNTLDLSDPLLFGKALANNMVRADYNPFGDWVLTAVFVPVFRPAQLPRTAPLAIAQIDRPAPVQEGPARDLLNTLATVMPPTGIQVTAMQPEVSLANAQYAARLAGRVLGQDVSLSYYNGRFGIPTPAWTINRADGVAEVGVIWPRMQVLGGDVAGSIEKLGGLGYWAEGAVIFPREVSYGIYNDNPKFGGNHTPLSFSEGCRDATMGSCHLVGALGAPDPFLTHSFRPIVIPDTPFLKLTVGVDYSIGEHVYLNAQYLHGFIDEFGAGVTGHLLNSTDSKSRLESRLGDYIVAGSDFKMYSGTVTLRLFLVAKLPSLAAGDSDYRFTGVIFPQLVWNVWEATELTVGAFVFLGDRSTKFGDPAAGASELFGKVKFTF